MTKFNIRQFKTKPLVAFLLAIIFLARPNPSWAQSSLGTIQFPDSLNLNASGIINSLVNIIMAIAGLLFFFLLLYGGIRYMTAGGDPKNSESARKIITNALLGLLIVVGAYFITSVLGRIFGIDFLNSSIPGLN